MPKAFLINYHNCFGCHACEVACQMLLQLPPDQFGIKVSQIGPWEYGADRRVSREWVYEYTPFFTDQCNRCADRVEKGKLPSCVQHCEAQCLKYGDVSELIKDLEENPGQILQGMK